MGGGGSPSWLQVNADKRIAQGTIERRPHPHLRNVDPNSTDPNDYQYYYNVESNRNVFGTKQAARKTSAAQGCEKSVAGFDKAFRSLHSASPGPSALTRRPSIRGSRPDSITTKRLEPC